MKVAAILFTAFLLISAPSSSAEARPEPTPQQIFDHWLSAYNSGELQRLQTVIASYKMEHSAQRDIDLRSSMGPWRLLEMRSSTPSIAEAIVSVEASERSLLVTVKVDESDPGDVTFFQIEGVETPAAYLPKRLSLRELRAEANQRLDALAVSDALSGALLVSERGRVLYQWWGGFADRQATLAITPETRFRIASLNKMFTAVAVLQLVHEGRAAGRYSIRWPRGEGTSQQRNPGRVVRAGCGCCYESLSRVKALHLAEMHRVRLGTLSVDWRGSCL